MMDLFSSSGRELYTESTKAKRCRLGLLSSSVSLALDLVDVGDHGVKTLDEDFAAYAEMWIDRAMTKSEPPALNLVQLMAFYAMAPDKAEAFRIDTMAEEDAWRRTAARS